MGLQDQFKDKASDFKGRDPLAAAHPLSAEDAEDAEAQPVDDQQEAEQQEPGS
ncbi:hypothetical protein ACIRPU_43730 [Streptomyces sp. NPDC102259]|uniref:hypothetical protein n=1 Tax=Streptomyces sp. NPDC102259 TaxID=3366148 RepID=UPI0037F7E415